MHLLSSSASPVIPGGPSLASGGVICFKLRSMIPAVVKKLLRYRTFVSASRSLPKPPELLVRRKWGWRASPGCLIGYVDYTLTASIDLIGSYVKCNERQTLVDWMVSEMAIVCKRSVTLTVPSNDF